MHVLVSDDGRPDALGLAYIDYAFSLSYEWTQNRRAGGTAARIVPRGAARGTLARAVEAIEDLPEDQNFSNC